MLHIDNCELPVGPPDGTDENQDQHAVRLHKAGYFRELLATNPDINEVLASLLRLCRETVVRLQKTESALIRSLEYDPLLRHRVERLMSIPAIGPINHGFY
jgi:hypothetical protein